MNPMTGELVKLRALEPADVDLLYAWENDPAVWGVSNTLAPFSRLQIEEYVFSSRNDVFGTRQLRLMIDLVKPSEDAGAIGSVDLFDIDPLHRRAGIGILVREPYRNRGLAREAVTLCIAYAFHVLHLHQLHCNILPSNEASIALFEKLGFEKCGIRRDWISDGITWHDEWIYQLIRRDE